MDNKKFIMAVMLVVGIGLTHLSLAYDFLGNEGYTAKYNSSEVGATVQDTIGSLFEALANNAGLIVIVIIGLFAMACFAFIFSKIKNLKR